MKNVVLLHPRMLFYKVRVYNALREALCLKGYNLVIWCCDIKACGEPLDFEVIDAPMTAFMFNKMLRDIKPCCVMSILFGVKTFLFNMYTTFSCKLNRVPIIYYGHGFDLRSTEKKWKLIVQNLFHTVYDRILLYSSREVELLWPVNRCKVFVANNTLILNGFENFNNVSKSELLREHSIKENKAVLFCGRIQDRKRLDILIDLFVHDGCIFCDVALVIVGQGLSEVHEKIIAKHDNIYYLGPIFDSSVLSEIFYMSTVFCIPGQIGLGLVEAMYWGLPVLTMNDCHGPEISYLVNGFNGFQAIDTVELGELLVKILGDPKLCDHLARNARSTFLEQASPIKMFGGFIDVLNSVCR